MPQALKRLFKLVWEHSLGPLHRDQIGAGYSLSVVLMIPLYIAFMGMTIEVHLLLNSHQAVQAALQTAGHSARAWTQHQDALSQSGLTLAQQVHQAVARNLLPFATSKTPPQGGASTTMAQALQEVGLSNMAVERYSQKLQYISQALRVDVSPYSHSSGGWRVQIEYDSPLWLPIFESVWATGRIDDIPIRTVRAETWVALEDDEVRRSEVGIPYDPRAAQAW